MLQQERQRFYDGEYHWCGVVSADTGPGADGQDAGRISGYGQKFNCEPSYPVLRPDEGNQARKEQSNGHQPYED